MKAEGDEKEEENTNESSLEGEHSTFLKRANSSLFWSSRMLGLAKCVFQPVGLLSYAPGCRLLHLAISEAARRSTDPSQRLTRSSGVPQPSLLTETGERLRSEFTGHRRISACAFL